jgi:hypothetical protein
MTLELSIMLLELSIMLLENIYSTGVTHDDHHIAISWKGLTLKVYYTIKKGFIVLSLKL